LLWVGRGDGINESFRISRFSVPEGGVMAGGTGYQEQVVKGGT